MTMVRINPLNEVVDLQKEMSRMFESIFPNRRGGEEEIPSAVWRPVVDIHEDENAFIIDAELPGLAKEDVKINFQDDTLTISGGRRYLRDSRVQNAEANEANAGAAEDAQPVTQANGGSQPHGKQGRATNVHRMERNYGKFIRSFSFPKAVNPEGIKATFENGVLSVVVPKAEATRPRQIMIG